MLTPQQLEAGATGRPLTSANALKVLKRGRTLEAFDAGLTLRELNSRVYLVRHHLHTGSNGRTLSAGVTVRRFTGATP